MNVLLIGFLSNGSSVHGGYISASQGIADALIYMQEQKIIDRAVFIDFQDILSASLNIPIDIGIIICSPDMLNEPVYRNQLRKLKLQCKKLYASLVWETEPLPTRWNFLWEDDIIDGFVSPSQFILKQIKKETTKDCYLLPHYIDISKYKPIDLEEKKNENEFKVLFIGQHTERKGFRDTVIGYLHSLSCNKDCSLVVKYHEMLSNHLTVEEEIQLLVKLNLPNVDKIKSGIYLLSQDLSSEQLCELYKECSLLLAPSRGEGFGLPPAECMSMGIPVIYTDWSAMPEVCSAPANMSIDYMVDIAYNMSPFGYESGQTYAVPNIKSIKDALETKYNEWKISKKDYYEKALKSRNIIDKKFGMNKIVEYLKALIFGG